MTVIEFCAEEVRGARLTGITGCLVIMLLVVLSTACNNGGSDPYPGPGRVIFETNIEQPGHDIRRIRIYRVLKYGVECDVVWVLRHRTMADDLWHEVTSNMACAQFSLEELRGRP